MSAMKHTDVLPNTSQLLNSLIHLQNLCYIANANWSGKKLAI